MRNKGEKNINKTIFSLYPSNGERENQKFKRKNFYFWTDKSEIFDLINEKIIA